MVRTLEVRMTLWVSVIQVRIFTEAQLIVL